MFNFVASVKIIPLEHVMFTSNILCPGDIIPYNCSIQSNSETVHLTWRVTIPGEMPINITYYNITDEITNLNSFITTTITDFRSDMLIHSMLEVSVAIADQILLECSIDDLQNDSTTVVINTSGM